MAALDRVFGLDEARLAEAGGLFRATADYAFLHGGRELLRGRARTPSASWTGPGSTRCCAPWPWRAGLRICPAARCAAAIRPQGWCAPAGARTFAAGMSSARRGQFRSAAGACAQWRKRAAWARNLAASIEVELPVGRGPGRFPREVRLPELHVGAASCVPGAGYGWVFPGPRGPKVGICGLRRGEGNFAGLFQRYLSLLGVERPGRACPCAAIRCPTATRCPRPSAGRLLLAGDAAGFVEPLFGEGIFYSMATGAHAASS